MDNSALNNLYIAMIESFFSGTASREEIEHQIKSVVPIDNEGAGNKLLESCGQSLRHINEIGYYTTERELSYLLSCLKSETEFSQNGLNDAINT